MSYSTPAILPLQSMLLSNEDFLSCFFRKPTERELEFLYFFHAVLSLLSCNEIEMLLKYHSKGRIGFDLLPILGIQILKLHYKMSTMKEKLLLLQKNINLREILGISKVPSPATTSRLMREVEGIVKPAILHERLIRFFNTEMDRVVGPLLY